MEQEYIERVGARENNLKNISLKIPKKKITIFTGVSGSGKSSIVFDTIAKEAGRQLNETFSKFIQGFLPKYGHPDVDAIENLSLGITVDQKRIGGQYNGKATDCKRRGFRELSVEVKVLEVPFDYKVLIGKDSF